MNTWVLMEKPEEGTPLYNAVLKQNVKIVKYLIEKGADIDYDSGGLDNDNIVLAAVKVENFEILKILVEAGADLNTQTLEGIIAYEYALDHLENEEMAEYLKANGARTEVNEEEVIPDYDPY
jgi:ankyrin repeat protein